MKVALYARYSTDMQSDASVEDQFRICEERCLREGWQVVRKHSDHGISGASMMRPGIQKLMQEAADGEFDIVVAEALDRLSRDQEDIAGIYKRLQFANTVLFTHSEGEISQLHIGLKGTMNALFLKDLADKTRRGLRGRVEKGRSGGGNCYGYDVVKSLDASEKGKRNINQAEAEIVRRIFTEFAKGIAPKKIATQLNKEGIPGPMGRLWGCSTIYGNRRRGVGILNNELYIGQLVWNRQSFVKHPETGKRRARMNPESEWVRVDMPELRIVDQDLWDAVKSHQKEVAEKPLLKRRRPVYLLSGLLECGKCGGGCSKVSQTHYGCSTARNKGTCDNRKTIRKDLLEEQVINALKARLMKPGAVEVYAREYTEHMNRYRMEQNANQIKWQNELESVRRKRDKIVKSIEDGMPTEGLIEPMKQALAREKELQELIDNEPEQQPLVHPNMATRYAQSVVRLIESLNDEDHRSEAASLMRTLIDKISLTPRKEGGDMIVNIHGDLAGILHMSQNAKNTEESVNQQVSLVAGGGTPSDLIYVTNQRLSVKNQVQDEVQVLVGAGGRSPSDLIYVTNQRLSVKNQVQDEVQVLVGAGVGFEPTTFRL